jgi:DNA-binding beta-propeller fold protein YncE
VGALGSPGPWPRRQSPRALGGRVAYRIGEDGHLRLLDDGGVSARLPPGSAPVDISVSRDGRFLYTVNAGRGALDAFRIDPVSGQLTPLGEIRGLPVSDGAMGLVAD